MKRTQLIIGIVSIILGIALAVMNITKIEGPIASGTYSIYPAAGFFLLGLVLLYRAVFKQPKA